MKNNPYSGISIKSELISSPHGFSTRNGGGSEGIYATLNLGMNRGDEEDRVIENWNRFLASAGIYTKSFVCGKQVHGNRVCIVSEADLRPAYGKGIMHECDGYVTSNADVPLAVFMADCVPVLMEDPVNHVIGAVHSGWRGTVSDIEKSAVDAFISLGSRPGDIRAAIGPAIDRCCFEVGYEVIDAVKDLIGEDAERYCSKRNDKYMLDLRGVVRHRLIMLGLMAENIDIVGECTMCHPDRYFSHRYSAGERGSLAAVICMNGTSCN